MYLDREHAAPGQNIPKFPMHVNGEDNKNTIQVYSVAAMSRVVALMGDHLAREHLSLLHRFDIIY